MAGPISVGFDARLLTHESSPTGVGIYVRELLSGLTKFPEVRMTLYSDHHIGEAPWDRLSRTVRAIGGLPWQQTALPWALWHDKPAVYHSPTFTLPLNASVPLVVTVHDLSMFRYPQYADPANLKYLRRLLPRSLKRANAIITVSHKVKAELIEEFGIDDSKIYPVWLGVDTDRWNAKPSEAVEDAKARYTLPEHYILFIGTREPRKNVKRLLEAFRMVSAKLSTTLVLAGRSGFAGSHTDELEFQLRNCPNVHVIPFVAKSDVPLLMQGASLLCYVSEYEGFGLPVLEALAVGTPVLTSRDTVMEEVGQDFVYYTDPMDPEAIAASIVQCVEAPDRSSRTEQAIEHARTFSWALTAAKTIQVYHEIAQP